MISGVYWPKERKLSSEISSQNNYITITRLNIGDKRNNLTN